MAIDFEKPYFQTLSIENENIVQAVDQINKIHQNDSIGKAEFKILIEDPLNMDASVSISLTNATLENILDTMLSGTGYHYVTQGDYIIISNEANPFRATQKPFELNEINVQDAICSIEINPNSSRAMAFDSPNTASAFLCKINGVKFLVTNIHVIENANSLKEITVKTRDNIEIKLTDGFVAQDRDVCIFRHVEDPRLTYLAISTSLSAKRSKDPVYLLGYPLGGGTMRKTEGSLEGVGHKLLEIDCSAFQGNSGGPVMDTIRNEVLGVLTKAEIISDDEFTKLAREKLGDPFKSDIRIFATRIDTAEDGAWERLNWRTWSEEKERLWNHYNTIAAVREIVNSKRIVANDITRRDADIWRMAKTYLIASDSPGTDRDRLNYLKQSFVRGMDIFIRPVEGSKWRELIQPWRYNWFASKDSGNISMITAENIKRLYQLYHDDWQNVVSSWQLDIDI
jgi:S1-C subfamily serine protease